MLCVVLIAQPSPSDNEERTISKWNRIGEWRRFGVGWSNYQDQVIHRSLAFNSGCKSSPSLSTVYLDQDSVIWSFLSPVSVQQIQIRIQTRRNGIFIFEVFAYAMHTYKHIKSHRFWC